MEDEVSSIKVHALNIARVCKPPIRVILQPIGETQGCLIIECDNHAWLSHRFNHLEGLPLGLFVVSRHPSALTKALYPANQKFIASRANHLGQIVREVQDVLLTLF